MRKLIVVAALVLVGCGTELAQEFDRDEVIYLDLVEAVQIPPTVEYRLGADGKIEMGALRADRDTDLGIIDSDGREWIPTGQYVEGTLGEMTRVHRVLEADGSQRYVAVGSVHDAVGDRVLVSDGQGNAYVLRWR